MLGEGWKVNISFYCADYWGEPGFGFYYNLNPKIEFQTDKVCPKPIAPAFAAMSYLLEGHTSAGRIEWLGAGVLGYAFERGDDIILVFWDNSGADRTVSVPVGVPAVTLVNWMGNERKAATADGELTLKLSGDPVYIQGVSKDVWSAAAVKPLTLSSSRAVAYPAGKLLVKGTAAVPKSFDQSKPLEAVVSVEMQASSGKTLTASKALSLSVKPTAFEIPVAMPINVTPGKYSVVAKLSAQGRTLFTTGMLAEVASPILTGDMEPLFDSKARPSGLSLKISEKRGAAASGTASVRIQGLPGAGLESAFSLAAGETKTIKFKTQNLAIDPLTMYKVDFKMALSDGYSQTGIKEVNFTGAAKFAAAPKINSDPAQWAAIPVWELKGKERVVRSPQYFKNQEVAFRMAWDEKNLYVFAEVKDTIFMQPYTGFDTWKGDCIQLDIDLDAGMIVAETGNLLADNALKAARRYTEIDLALTKNGPEAFRTATFDSKALPANLIPKNQVDLSVLRKGDKTIYEAAISWKALGAKSAPKAGDIIGIAATFNDRNEEKQLDPSALGFFELQNPKRFGKVVLLSPASGK
ncbi:MAG: sugar-binding protein, partial [Chitinivibrionales bacterium]|nr:sugar-binding protein [Chitinivibrionales bacterium]